MGLQFILGLSSTKTPRLKIVHCVQTHSLRSLTQRLMNGHDPILLVGNPEETILLTDRFLQREQSSLTPTTHLPHPGPLRHTDTGAYWALEGPTVGPESHLWASGTTKMLLFLQPAQEQRGSLWPAGLAGQREGHSRLYPWKRGPVNPHKEVSTITNEGHQREALEISGQEIGKDYLNYSSSSCQLTDE